MTVQASNDPTAFNDFEHKGWQVASGSYEHHFARVTRQTTPTMLDAARVGEGMRVLDVCTGPGILASAAVERGANTVGLDFSAEFIKKARRNVPDAKFHEGDAQNLPFDDDEFDAVVCGYGIIHLPDPLRALEEMRRVLKPGGQVAVSVWEAAKPTNSFGVLFGALATHGNLDVPLPHGPDFFQFSTGEAMAAALEAADFKDVFTEGVEQIWTMEHSSDLIHALMEASVRARGLLAAQTEDARAAIDTAVEEGLEQFAASGGGYSVAMPAIVGSGVK